MRIEDHELTELRDLAETTATVAAAADAGVYRAFAAIDGPATAEQVAGRAGLDIRAVRILLPVLAEIGVLERRVGTREAGSTGGADLFTLTDDAHRALADPHSDDYEAGGLPLWIHNLRAFTHLPDVLRSGEPLEREEETEEEARDSLERFMAGMAAAPRERVERIVDACLDRAAGVGRAGGVRTALDLGGGPGHMAREFAARGLETTLFDRPETIEFVADEYGLAGVDGLGLAGGDFMEDPLPDGPFDVVLISNVVHIYSPAQNRALLEKVAGVTSPGGVVAIADFFRGRSRRAVHFALVMLLRTEGGNTYSEEEVGAWLDEAGFRSPETVQVDEDRHLVTAVRGG